MGDISNPPGDGDFTFEETQALEYDDVFRARTGSGKRMVSTAALSGFWDGCLEFLIIISRWGSYCTLLRLRQASAAARQL